MPVPLYINGRFLTQTVTGVQRYCLEVLRAWDDLLARGELDAGQARPVCLVPPSYQGDPGWRQIEVRRVGRLGGNLWEQLDLPRFARGGRLFSPANIGPLLLPGQVVTIHDASVFAIPQAYSLAFRLKYQLSLRVLGQTARRIITPSEFSRRELARWAGIDPAKMVVIPESGEHILRVPPDPGIFERFPIGRRPFFLTVGSQSPHKNLAVVLEAARRLPDQNFDLVLAGGEFARVFQAGALDLPPNAVPVGYVSDGELRALYERARAFIFPSLYEGFGLPPLEALACGCPVICARAGSLPEVCSEAAVFFDPDDADELVRKMQDVAETPHSNCVSDWLSVGKQTWQAL